MWYKYVLRIYLFHNHPPLPQKSNGPPLITECYVLRGTKFCCYPFEAPWNTLKETVRGFTMENSG